MAVDPYIPVGKVPTDEHDVPLLVIVPVVGIAMVPVTPVGSGLTPGVVISVDPSGIPVAPIPSGEVAPSEGIADIGSVSGSSTWANWANAGLAQSNGQAVATTKNGFMEVSPIIARGLCCDTIGRSHELRTDRIPDRLSQNEFDCSHCGVVDVPANDIRDR